MYTSKRTSPHVIHNTSTATQSKYPLPEQNCPRFIIPFICPTSSSSSPSTHSKQIPLLHSILTYLLLTLEFYTKFRCASIPTLYHQRSSTCSVRRFISEYCRFIVSGSSYGGPSPDWCWSSRSSLYCWF